MSESCGVHHVVAQAFDRYGAAPVGGEDSYGCEGRLGKDTEGRDGEGVAR